VNAEEEKQIESEEESEPGDRNSCPNCRKYMPARTFHCNVCKGCVIGRDHHNFFLNCCIGRFNHKYFFAGCVSCFSTLLLFANLSLTSVCHPFPVFMVFGVNVLLPDDCSGVFIEGE
jgi:palmitoyltransferase